MENKKVYNEFSKLNSEYFDMTEKMRKALIGLVNEHGGLLDLNKYRGYDDMPYVITQNTSGEIDLFYEARCLALKVVDDELMMYCLRSDDFNYAIKHSYFVEFDYNCYLLEYNWYTLNWDEDNSYQHNVERLCYYFENVNGEDY